MESEGESDGEFEKKIKVIQDMADLDYLDFEMVRRDNRSVLSDISDTQMRLSFIEKELVDANQ